MRRANLIAIRVGTTEGVMWEIEKAVSLGRPQHLVLLIPFTAPHYKQFVNRAGHFFPQGLPDWPLRTEPRDGVEGQNTTSLDIKAVVHFYSRWQGVLNCLEPTKRPAVSSRPLKDPLIKALEPAYERLVIPPRRITDLPRTAKAAVNVFFLTAGLVLGILIAFKIGPALKPLAAKGYTLHIFSKTRSDRITEIIPGPYGVALRNEINQSEVVRTWFESAPNSALRKMDSRVAAGMPGLPDELLEKRNEILRTIVNALDTERCGVFIRSISGPLESLADSLASNLLQLIQTYLGPDDLRLYAHITVKSIEADLTKVPIRRVTKNRVMRAVTEVLDLLSEQDRARMINDLQQYDLLENGEICWVERTFNQALPRLSADTRSVLLRAPFVGRKPQRDRILIPSIDLD